MNTKKEKPIQRAYPLGVDTVQRPVLLEAQKFLSDEIDEWSKMLDHANSPFKVRPFVGVELAGRYEPAVGHQTLLQLSSQHVCADLLEVDPVFFPERKE